MVRFTFAGLCGVADGRKVIPGIDWAVKVRTGIGGLEQVVFQVGCETHRLSHYVMSGKTVHEVKRAHQVETWDRA